MPLNIVASSPPFHRCSSCPYVPVPPTFNAISLLLSVSPQTSPSILWCRLRHLTDVPLAPRFSSPVHFPCSLPSVVCVPTDKVPQHCGVVSAISPMFLLSPLQAPFPLTFNPPLFCCLCPHRQSPSILCEPCHDTIMLDTDNSESRCNNGQNL